MFMLLILDWDLWLSADTNSIDLLGSMSYMNVKYECAFKLTDIPCSDTFDKK